MIKLKKYEKNPIIRPNPSNFWEAKATFNAGILKIKNKIFIIYRALSEDNTSCLGLAISEDGFTIDERLDEPIYVPREHFEMKIKGRKNTGCEDPRLSIIEDRIYMCYTAVGESGPFIRVSSVETTPLIRVAFTSIKIKDFLNMKWEKWEKPILISPPGTWDKNACLIEKKIKNKFVFFHRIFPNIWIDFVEKLDFKEKGWLSGFEVIGIREDKWDSDRIGIAGPPIYTKEGWILIYHGKSKFDKCYRLGAILFDKENPFHIISRLDYPILEPTEKYEGSIVFSCGQAVIDEELFLYYGADDKTVCVATCNLNELLEELIQHKD